MAQVACNEPDIDELDDNGYQDRHNHFWPDIHALLITQSPKLHRTLILINADQKNHTEVQLEEGVKDYCCQIKDHCAENAIYLLLPFCSSFPRFKHEDKELDHLRQAKQDEEHTLSKDHSLLLRL